MKQYKWVPISSDTRPEKYKPVIVYCPDWCDEEYQICFWDGSKFTYADVSNERFNEFIEAWTNFEYKGDVNE